MPVTLEVILVIAAIALIALAICLIPLTFLAWRELSQLAQAIELVKVDVDVLLRETRETVRSIGELSKRANEQMDDVAKVVHSAEVWTERADWLVQRVSAAVEPPVATLVHKAGVLGKGVGAFVRVMARGSRQVRTGKEKDNV